MISKIENKLNIDQQKKVEENIYLVYKYVDDKIESNPSLKAMKEEIISECMLKLCYSSLNFDNNGSCFSTFAFGGFDFALKNILCEIDKLNKIDKLCRDLYNHEIGDKSFVNVESENIFDRIRSIKLSDTELTLLDKYFCQNMSFGDISKERGVSKQTIFKDIKKVINKIKLYCNNNGLTRSSL